MRIAVAETFTKTPGARSPEEGPFSGEEFLEKVLSPSFETCLARNELLEVDLDGTEGYATSFLEASFGGLARKFAVNQVTALVRILSKDEPYLVDEVAQYIRQARDQ